MVYMIVACVLPKFAAGKTDKRIRGRAGVEEGEGVEQG